MKKIMPLPVMALLFLSACAPAPTSMNPSGSGQSLSSLSMSVSSPAAAETASSVQQVEVPAGIHVITMTVTDFAFSPSTIRVKKGENVVLRLTAVNGTHGFGATELGLNVRIEPGETQDIVIPTGTAGTFAFKCSVPCGSGHREMTGTIIIEE